MASISILHVVNIRGRIVSIVRSILGGIDMASMVLRRDFPRKRRHFPAELQLRVSDRQDGRCVYCGYGFGADDKGVTVDHIVPVAPECVVRE